MKKSVATLVVFLFTLVILLPLAYSQSLSLDYSTYLGDSYGALGIAVDSTGTAFVTGYTRSSSFPTVNPYQPSFGGGSWDAFVIKLAPSGSSLIYSMYLGGSGDEISRDIAIEAGEAYLCGYTSSVDFPTANPYQAAGYGGRDCFISKLSSSGSILLFSTYMGGAGDEEGYGISVNGGEVYLTGYTGSDDFPTQNPYQPERSGDNDAFISKLSSTGSILLFSTYFGGYDDDRGYDISLENGSAYLTGRTESDDFPTENPYQAEHAGEEDAFISKLASSGSFLLFSTYYGGYDDESGYGISIENGEAYLTGYTSSDDFPTKNPYQSGLYTGNEVFVGKFTSSGSLLLYSTYLGGSYSSYEIGRSIAVENGEATVGGYTGSSDFPVLNSYQPSKAGGAFDAFIIRISTDGSSLIYSTYLGGSETDRVFGISVRDGTAYVCGRSNSTDFPTVNPYQANYAGDYNPFISKLSFYTPTPTPIGYKTPSPTPTTSPTPSVTPSPTTTPSPTVTPTPTATASPPITPTPTPYGYRTPTPTPTIVSPIIRSLGDPGDQQAILRGEQRSSRSGGLWGRRNRPDRDLPPVYRSLGGAGHNPLLLRKRERLPGPGRLRRCRV